MQKDREPLLTPGGPAAAPNENKLLKYGSLAFLIVQNSTHVLLLRYSRVVPGVCSTYVVSMAVLFAELLKLVMCLLVLVFNNGLGGACALLHTDIWSRKFDTLKVSVPALCYTLQNNLWYYALSHLDPVTAAVTSQMKVITTAVATVLMLDRRLNLPQWGALLVLTLGLVVMQLQDKTGGNGSQDRNSLSGAGSLT